MKIILAKKRRRAEHGRHRIYRVWYGDELVYCGKTSQAIGTVLRRHFFTPNKTYCPIDVLQVTKVEEQDHKTMADCAIYLMYYICKFRPRLNAGRWERDFPSISLPLVKWNELVPVYLEQWCEEKYLIMQEQKELLKQRRKEWNRERLMCRCTFVPEDDDESIE